MEEWTKREKVLAVFLIGICLTSLGSYLGYAVAASTRAVTPDNIVLINDLENITKTSSLPWDNITDTAPIGPYSFMISTFTNATATYYQATNGTDGKILDSWTSTNATSIINNVISVADGIIYFNSGTYTLNGSITANGKDNIKLLTKNAILSASANMNTAIIYLQNCDNWLIDGFTIDGNMAMQTVTDTGGTNNEADGILINGVSNNNFVTNCLITDIGLMGFRVGDGSSASNGISHSIITFCDWNGIGFGLGTQHNYVENCEIAYCSDVGISTYGSSTIITNNYIHTMNGTGGYLESHTQWGIGIEGGGDTKVTQNTITDCTTGIQNAGFDGCTIESNTIGTMVDCGIVLQTGSSYNNIVNNNVSTTTGDTKHCIYLEGTLNNLHGNFISGATGNGLQVNGNNNTIINNHVFSNTVQGINLNCNGSFVSSNDIYGNTGGLCIEANSWTNIIKGNNLRNNGWAEIYDLGNSTIKIDNIANYVPL